MANETSCSGKTIKEFGFLDEEKTTELENAIVQLIEGNKELSMVEMRQEILEIITTQGKKMQQNAIVKLGDKLKINKVKSEIAAKTTVKKVETTKDAAKLIDEQTKAFLGMMEGKNSIDTLNRVETTFLKNSFYGALERDGLMQYYTSGKYNDLIMEQNWRIANKKKDILQDIPEGYTKEQVEIADRIHKNLKKTTNLMLDNQRSVGLPIAERKDWLFKHTFSRTKLTAMGKDAFVALVRKHGNMKAMFPKTIASDENKIADVLGGVYEQILASKDSYKGSEQLSGFMGKLKSRKLEFSSGFDEAAFFKEVSDAAGLVENVDISMDQAGRAYSTVKTLGVRSEKNFNTIMGDLEQNFRKNLEGKFSEKETNSLINRYRLKMETVKDAYVVVSANPNTPKGAISNTVNVIRALNSMSKLGSSLFTAMYDGITLSLQYSLSTGDHQFKTFYQTAIDGFSATWNMKKRKEFAELMNVMTYINDPALAMGGNRGDFKTGMDIFNRFVTSAYKWTGVPFQTEISRNVGGMLQSRAIKKAVIDFKKGDLNGFQKLKLERYGITDADMEIMSSVKTKSGTPDIIAPLDIMEIPLEKFSDIPEVAYKMRRDLFDKFGNWVDDAVQAGTPTPTARTKRILRKGENIENEMVRAATNLMMQFKETAAKIVDENIQAYSDYGKAAGGLGQAKGLGLYALNGMISYMLIESTKAYMLNKKTPWEKAKEKDGARKLFIDYVNKSSFLPVLTDFGASASDKYWRSAVPNSILGPSFSMGMDTLQAAHNPSRKNLGKVGKHLVPLNNHFGIKAIERYLLGIDLLTGQKIRK